MCHCRVGSGMHSSQSSGTQLMYADPFMVLVVLVLGCAAFFFGVIYFFFRLISGVGRGLYRMLYPERSSNPRRHHGRLSTVRVCPRPACGKREHRAANFCSQCGTPLVETSTPHSLL